LKSETKNSATELQSDLDQAGYWLSVDDMSCGHCVESVHKAVLGVAGVRSAVVDLEGKRVQVIGGSPEPVMAAIEAAGYGTQPLVRADIGVESSAYWLKISGMSCANCVGAVERAILAVPGVADAAVDLVEQRASVVGGEPGRVVEAITSEGYDAELVKPDSATALQESYEISIEDMTCSSCVATVESCIKAVPGVRRIQVDLLAKTAQVEGGDPLQVIGGIEEKGYRAKLAGMSTRSDSLKLVFSGDPMLQQKKLEQFIQFDDLHTDCQLHWPILQIETTEHPADLILRLRAAELDAVLGEVFVDPYAEQAQEARAHIRDAWQRALLAGSVGASLMVGDMAGLMPELTAKQTWLGVDGQLFWGLTAFICLFTMWFSGRNFYLTALRLAKHLSANMDTLVALGTSAAWVSSVILIVNPDFIPGGGRHLYLDAAVLILAFLQFGKALETRAKRTTSEAIGSLVKLTPKRAAVVRDLGEVSLPVSLLHPADRIRVRPGETVPIDGRVLEGSSSVDESMLSGEPVPVSVSAGSDVTGGTINRSGTFLFQVSRIGDETTLSHIIAMVKRAQLSKPPIARLVDRISSVFVPVVIVISMLTFFAWYLLGPEPILAYALTAGIAVLVIACPCALGLATPIAVMMGTGRAAQLNILIRNSDALQGASALDCLVMDKTGTLTQGAPELTDLMPVPGVQSAQLLHVAASLELASEHPLGEAIVRRAEMEGIDFLPVTDFHAEAGRGITGVIDGSGYLLGNQSYMQERGLGIPPNLVTASGQLARQGGTPVWLADADKVLGLLGLKDPIRADSADAVRALQRQGLQIVMCTGDNRVTADAVAAELGISEAYSELLPEEKLNVVKRLQQQGRKVGMVGDGVNDAPALAQADTGFAIGGGTDVAIGNADITLAGDSLANVETAVAISRATLNNIKQNLFGAFVYNVIGIPLAAGLFYPLTGWLLEPMFASAAMALSSVTVVTNANRLRFFKPQVSEFNLQKRLN